MIMILGGLLDVRGGRGEPIDRLRTPIVQAAWPLPHGPQREIDHNIVTVLGQPQLLGSTHEHSQSCHGRDRPPNGPPPRLEDAKIEVVGAVIITTTLLGSTGGYAAARSGGAALREHEGPCLRRVSGRAKMFGTGLKVG